jgi:hypothetical protein
MIRKLSDTYNNENSLKSIAAKSIIKNGGMRLKRELVYVWHEILSCIDNGELSIGMEMSIDASKVLRLYGGIDFVSEIVFSREKVFVRIKIA